MCLCIYTVFSKTVYKGASCFLVLFLKNLPPAAFSWKKTKKGKKLRNSFFLSIGNLDLVFEFYEELKKGNTHQKIEKCGVLYRSNMFNIVRDFQICFTISFKYVQYSKPLLHAQKILFYFASKNRWSLERKHLS